jgi:hypothetical protein
MGGFETPNSENSKGDRLGFLQPNQSFKKALVEVIKQIDFGHAFFHLEGLYLPSRRCLSESDRAESAFKFNASVILVHVLIINYNNIK